jgi:small-conductance mechanosensitive channel
MSLFIVLSGCNEATVQEIDEASVQEIYEPIVTRTPVPTMAPGPVEELLLGIAESSEIAEGTFLGLSVEDWISILNSALFVLVGWTLGVWFIRFLIRIIIQRTPTQVDDEFFKLVDPQIKWLVMIFCLYFATRGLGLLSDTLWFVLQDTYFMLFFGILFYILWKLLDFSTQRYRAQLDPGIDIESLNAIITLVDRVVRILLSTIYVVIVLGHFGIAITGIAAMLGFLALALSLAAQDTLSDAISGFLILVDQPFRVGDRIEISELGTWGDVTNIGTRTTRILTTDNRMVIVPNSTIGKSQVVNYSIPDPRYRVQIDIGIGYGQDIEKVCHLIVDTVRKVEGVLPDKPVDAIYNEMGNSGMIFRIRWWIESYEDTNSIFGRVNTALQNSLDQAGIELPFTTYDINLKNMPPGGEVLSGANMGENR